ncbi:MAG: aminopeptidase N [Arsenophonus endosymbiont of Ceratovacuna japonica]
MIHQRQIKYRKDYKEPNYIITDIELDFILDPIITIVTAISRVKQLNSNDNTLILNGENLIFRTIHINNKPWLNYREEPGKLIIESVPKTFILKIVNEIKPLENTILEGLYVSDNILCTQCEPEGFRHITYYLDRPDVLANFTTRITADKSRYPYLLSNGNQIDKGDIENNLHWVMWKDPFPKPSYLFALVAGDFSILYDNYMTQSGRNIKLVLFVDKDKINYTNWAMTCLKNAMRWDEVRFNYEYDLDIYMIVAVNFFNMGAMENKGLNIFNSKYILAKKETTTDDDYMNIKSIVAHEYFHNWTGNRITCRDWFQLSLKEGLTVFRDNEFTSDLGYRLGNRIKNIKLIRAQQFIEDNSPISHPIRPETMIEINNFYTLTIYEKGAEIIRMLHTLLGEKQFQAGMKLYTVRYDGNAATCEDFVKSMQDASNIDLTLFCRWYSQSGTPLVTVKDEYLLEKKQYLLHISQITMPTVDQKEKLPLHIPIDIELYDIMGNIIPLQYNGYTINSVLNLVKEQQTFIFDHISAHPIPSLLCNFSAPVKLKYSYTDEQLILLMQYTNNKISCWDASQSLLSIYIKQNVVRLQQNKDLILPSHVIDIFRTILISKNYNQYLKAQIFTLPSYSEISEWFEIIDPISICNVINFITKQFANKITNEFITTYHENKLIKYSIDYSDIAKRSLRNICLFYLAFSDNQHEANNYVINQYKQSNNMTDTISALNASMLAQLPSRKKLMLEFEQRWNNDSLIMDKWFILNAINPDIHVLTIIRSLLNHITFSINNPNKVRALIGTFVMQNNIAFHANDGSGYNFLVEMLIILNDINPQMASYLIKSLICIKRYDKNRQNIIRDKLKKLQELANLSDNLFETISKIL